LKLLSAAAALLLSTIHLNGQTRFDATAVWNPPDDVSQQMREACQTEPHPVECVTGFMRQHGAPAQAVEFSRLMDGSGYMIGFAGSADWPWPRSGVHLTTIPAGK